MKALELMVVTSTRHSNWNYPGTIDTMWLEIKSSKTFFSRKLWLKDMELKHAFMDEIFLIKCVNDGTDREWCPMDYSMETFESLENRISSTTIHEAHHKIPHKANT